MHARARTWHNDIGSDELTWTESKNTVTIKGSHRESSLCPDAQGYHGLSGPGATQAKRGWEVGPVSCLVLLTSSSQPCLKESLFNRTFSSLNWLIPLPEKTALL